MSCRTARSLTAMLIGVVAGLALTSLPAQAADTTTLTVVHGVRGLVADVYLDGKDVLRSFEPMRITDPLPVPPGRHKVEIRETGASKTSKPLVAGTVQLAPGSDSSAVAHLDENGEPALTVYTNDVARVASGRARVSVRQVAAADAVDVRLGGNVLARGLTNGDQQTAVVAAGTYPVTTRPAAGGGQLLLPARQMPVRAGELTALYLIGSAKDGNLTWLAQQVEVAQPVPTGVAAGDGPAPRPVPPAVAVLAVAAAVGAGALLLRRRTG